MRTTGHKRGDFIMLDRNIFAIDPFYLHDTRVMAIYLDGREVYAAKASRCGRRTRKREQ
jgi:hypothetical protein